MNTIIIVKVFNNYLLKNWKWKIDENVIIQLFSKNMFKKEIEINDKEDPQGLFVKTPCFGGKEDQTLEKSWRRSTETAQKSCITEELETSKVSFPREFV